MKGSFKFAFYILSAISVLAILIALFMIEIAGETPQAMSLLFYSVPVFLISFAIMYHDMKKYGCIRPAKPREAVLPYGTPEAFRQALTAQIPIEGYAPVSKMQSDAAFWWKKAEHITKGIEVGENLGIVVGSGKETPEELHTCAMTSLNGNRFRWSFLYVNYGYGMPNEWKETLSFSTRIHLGLNTSQIDAHAYYDLETKTLYMQRITQGKMHIVHKAFNRIWDNLNLDVV